MEKIVSLAKRRGFIFPGSEIYGGFANTWDYGPLGVELKNNVKRAWWKNMVRLRDDIVGLDSAILMNPRVWAASGHVSTFSDPLIECKRCHERFREDNLWEGKYGEIKTEHGKPLCPVCGGELTESRKFNLMFKTFAGPVEDEAHMVYLRPETAQGIFVNFKNVASAARMKIPFGVAQIGKAFRNEITPGNFTFRTREFEQMEMEFFVEPGTDGKWFEQWVKNRIEWYLAYGIKKENLRLREHKKEELSHYSKATSDIEYKFPFSAKGGPASGGGWGELEGVANRTDFDLKQHQKTSGRDLSYFDEEKKKAYLPYVIEPSAGADRAALAFLIDAYDEIEGGRTTTTKSAKEKEVVLRLHPELAPIKAAILPLVKKEPLKKLAEEIYRDLKEEWMVQYDEVGSVGRRYRRQDEIGTPFCVTIDFDSLEKNDVTVRDRDTMKQDRVKIAELIDYLSEKLI